MQFEKEAYAINIDLNRKRPLQDEGGKGEGGDFPQVLRQAGVSTFKWVTQKLQNAK